MQPLRRLVSAFENAKSNLKWNEYPEAKQAFYSTKALTSMIPQLFFYDETAPIFLLTGAGDCGIGGYLYQLVYNNEQPVAFISKSLSGPT